MLRRHHLVPHSSGSETIAKDYNILDAQASNPVIQNLVSNYDFSGVFHKQYGQVVSAPFQRSHLLNGYSLEQVLDNLFIQSGFLCENLVSDGFMGFDRSCAQYKFRTPQEQASFIGAVTAQPLGQNIWFKRYGMGKNFAPRFSPISWWIFAAEDQKIVYDSANGIAHVIMTTVCIDLGEHLRTIRYFRLRNVGPNSVEITMLYGAINARSGQIDRDAVSIREQAFGELNDPNWKWAMKAENYLRNSQQHF